MTKRTSRKPAAKTKTTASLKDPIDSLGKLLKALAMIYKTDPTVPGLTLSWLPKEGKFYGATQRYRSDYGRDRYNLSSVKADSIGEVLRTLATRLLEERDILMNLEKSIR